MPPVESVTSELQRFAPSQIIELYELQLKAALHGTNDVYRFHAGVNAKPGAGDIVWAGNVYSAYPVETEGFEYNGEGQLPRPKLRVSNQFGLITAILLAVNDPVTGTPGNDLVGATVRRIRVLARHLDAVNWPSTGFISRASTATFYDASGIIQTAGIDVARSDAYEPDGSGGFTSIGLLLEAQASNLVTWSEALDTAAWTKGNTVPTANVVTAPNNESTGDELRENTSTAIHYAYFTLVNQILRSTNYTYSRYYKNKDRRYIRHSFVTGGSADGIYCDVDLQAGTIINQGAVGTGSLVSATIEQFPNGWYRVIVSGSVASGSGTLANAYPVSTLRNSTTNAQTEAAQAYTGDGSSAVYLWGAQIETGTTATSYIPTGASQVTRAADVTGNVNPYGTPDPTAELPRDVYSIARKVTENRDLVEFELASAFDLAGVNAPRRLCISNICNWVYRSAECGYTGDAYFDDNDQPVALLADDVCSKRLAGCEARFAPVTFTATVTAGSTTLSSISSAALASISTGDPLFGHGIPAGTTVVSKSTSSLVMSQAATAGPSYSYTGTLIGPDGITMTVSSTTGLVAGMTVTGQDVPAGTTIQSISGSTITLSIGYNPNSKGGSITKTATVDKALTPSGTEHWLITNTSGLSIGMLAGTNAGLSVDQPHGTGVYAGTKIGLITTNVRVGISAHSKLADDEQITAIFWTPKTFTSATYTFTASNQYTARANNNLPYGSYPGVGAFYS